MYFSLFIIVTVAVVLFLCLGVFVYFQIYKKNINKALNNNINKPKHMVEPYKVVFVLVVLFVSFAITLTSVAGLIYSKNYFSYEKDTAENMASRTVYVDYSFENDNLRCVNSSDIEKINQIIARKFPGRNINVIPVYSVCSGIYLNDEHVNLFAFPKEYCSFFGLDTMQDNTAYFYNAEESKAEFQISVTKIVDNGFVSDKLEKLIFEAKNGVSKKSLVSVIEEENMTPSMREDPICFVTMESFYKIVSIMLETEVKSEFELDEYSSLIPLEGIYICSDKLSSVNSISSTLVQQNYNSYSPIDTFGDFEESISNTFIVFILSSVALIFLSAVNIFITVKTAKRIKDKENI
ncbi:MAG: hypothetical protein J1E34_07015 [Oscillospiraceae bacterium]|nr:hypothetical protein [Oscillospiraceae bacterium]